MRSLLSLAAKRLLANLGLEACVALGLVVAVALAMSVPLYADAVTYRLLQEELEREGRPPFAFMFRYVGAWHGAVEWEDYLPLDSYLTERAPGAIGLPLSGAVRHVKSDDFRLFPASEAYAGRRSPLAWASLGFISGLAPHIQVIEGRWPTAEAEATEVLVSRAMAEELGLQVGEEYILFAPRGAGKPFQLTVEVAGVWQPLDPAEPFWFYPPRQFDKVLLVPEEAFSSIAADLRGEVNLALWYLIFDGRGVHIHDLPSLSRRIATVRSAAASLLPNTTLDLSPLKAMEKHRRAASLLTVLLYVFSVPIMGLILYFIVLISGMVVRRQRGEIAVLRSRGSPSLQIVGIYLLEGLLLSLAALGVGPLLGRWGAQLMCRARSFLSLANRPSLPVAISPESLRFALLAVAMALLASLLPALSAARHTVVTYKQEVARSLRRPLWQRYFLDLILLAPSLYGYYQLRKRGTISFLGRGIAGDPFTNPLLFLVPAFFIFALALIFLRLLPHLMEGLAWLAQRLGGVSSFLALRHLARSPGDYIAPLLLLIVTLSLASFTASMAGTVDAHLSDLAFYQVGADMNLAEMGESTEEPMGPFPPGEAPKEAQWLFLPVSEHLRVPGVKAAARVGDYRAVAHLSGRTVQGRFLGIDRVDFPRAAFFRCDFAPRPLGALMNALALDRANLLVSRPFLVENGLLPGDRIVLDIDVMGERKRMEFTIADVLDFFPTAYPEDGPFFIGNLDYVFEQMGGLYPYDVWLALEEGADEEAIIQGVRELGVRVVSESNAPALIAVEQGRPERQGFFGVLSIGFLASALLTILGFLLHSFISFRQRSIGFGIMRAIGLSAGQMALSLAIEELALILSGAAGGTAIGVGASLLFIPFLQVRAGGYPQTPPFIVQIAWGRIGEIYLVFGVMWVAAMAASSWLLRRLKIFEVVRLGEVR